MTSPSIPSSATTVNPDSASSPTVEEEAEVNAPDKNLPVLKWTESSFNNLMTTVQMPVAYGARYPQEGDTTGDAPTGYVSMFADWFDACNLRLPLTVFMGEVLEYYKIHISQLSPLGMLWILRMMLGGRLDRKARPVLLEKNEEAPLWRMFCSDFDGKIEIVKCGPGEEGWNETILINFRVPSEAALNAVLHEGKRHLGALGDPDATGVPKVSANLVVDKQRRKKKSHATVTLPHLVSEAASTFCPRLRKYEDYMVVSDTLEGLSVPGGSSGASGATAGTKPVDDKKLKGDATVAGGEKAPKFRKTRATAVPKQKPAVSAEPFEEPVSLSTIPSSPPKVVDVEAQKKGGENPSIEVGDEVIGDPSACRETLRGLGTPVETAPARGLGHQNLQSQLASMLVGGSVIVNAIMEDYYALACREEENIRLRVQAEAMMETAQAGKEQLEKEKAAFEKLKQTERWAASAGLEQVRSLAKPLSDELKLWKEACARENEKLFRVRQELNNLKVVNAALVKEKSAAEAAIKEAETRGATALKEAEARAAKELADANADRTKLNKVVEELQ
ncbi:hypothetical protein HanRHA438_Chr07g0309211 [Helianthus annuus]|uniref:Transposase (Putative), gypsy type n=1 Tax=Helianthus annuus TaxID=4232 RepID=A0A9K3ILV0_HELAN|nr:hypothetical protein HanXRQr2_Chr07g0298931 [Helianthus annuus]KAJ0550474.1 hypothetical protein HanHA300_Chr07g0245861 [Helianthus annuus]KAJ0557221.1 hypothetical protein HanIR_Chr07g0322711 [Helianthus annuus]KAJ0563432.1 hypothetical protein HanHA89_Chr07g0263081 [Helianthus annuus]KAJ0728769.1 hypothetical protein HanLR1_Chr07g0245441 [Helianthus annuus]